MQGANQEPRSAESSCLPAGRLPPHSLHELSLSVKGQLHFPIITHHLPLFRIFHIRSRVKFLSVSIRERKQTGLRQRILEGLERIRMWRRPSRVLRLSQRRVTPLQKPVRSQREDICSRSSNRKVRIPEAIVEPALITDSPPSLHHEDLHSAHRTQRGGLLQTRQALRQKNNHRRCRESPPEKGNVSLRLTWTTTPVPSH